MASSLNLNNKMSCYLQRQVASLFASDVTPNYLPFWRFLYKNIFSRAPRSGEEARAGREFPSPSTPFLPTPPERFGILRNAAGVSLKMGSRIIQYRPPNRILQIFGSGKRGLLAAPTGAARKK